MRPVVARGQELNLLHEFIERRRDGPAALVLEGEAGIGKTTLWRAGVAYATERGLRTLAAFPARAERELANAGLGDLLEDVLDEALPGLPAPRREALELALLRTSPDGRVPEPRAIGVAVRSVLAALADDAPLLLAIDDEQWLDASSAFLLEFALRRLPDRPIGLLLARRAGEPGARLERALGDDRVELISLQPLSLGATHTLIRQALGASLARPTLLRIHETSGGNPFFALELARALGDSPVQESRRLPMPATLEAAVHDRLQALGRRSDPVLLAAASLSSPSVELLERGWPGSAGSLERAERAGILDVQGLEIRFAHPLFASVLYERATSLERRQVHGTLAGLVSEPIEHARHLALAAVGPDAETAHELEAAASHARALGASIAAAELGELAVERTPLADADTRRRRGLQVARDHFASGAANRAREVAEALLASSDSDHGRAEALLLRAEFARTREEALTLMRETLESAAGSPRLEATVHAWLATYLRFTAGTCVAEEHAVRSVAIADSLGDQALSSSALAALAMIRFQAGRADALELSDRALDVARGSGDQRATEAAVRACAHNFFWAGELAQARELLAEEHDAVAGRDLAGEGGNYWMLALLEWRAGNWAIAHEHAEHSRELYAMLDPEAEVEALLPRALIAAHRGEEPAARALAEAGVRAMEAHGEVLLAGGFHGTIGQVELWSGHPAAAVERFERGAEARRSVGYRDPAQARFEADHVEALVELGRFGDALALLEPWERDAERLDRGWALAQTIRCRGLIAAALGELDAAIELLDESVERHAAVGDPFGRARALFALGRVRRSARQNRAAREALGEALAAFEAVGAAAWVERTELELGRIGGRTREHGLTPAETRVAELVAEGRTNREVAAALFLSEKTVESHLSRIYAKLDVRSRTELTRELVRS